MLQLKGRSYEVMLVDTNVLSDALKDNSTGRRLLSRSASRPAIIGIAIWTLIELRRKPELYERFLEVFGVMPFVVFKTRDQLLRDEIARYPDPSGIQGILAAFGPLNDGLFSDPRTFFDQLFEKPEAAEAERRWNEDWTQETLESMLALRSNFPPGPDGYKKGDARRFVEMAVFEQLARFDPKWTKRKLRKGLIATRAFPSLQLILYCVFYRFYEEGREPELPDVFDLLIHAVSPYVDTVLTEAFQVELLKKVQSRDPGLPIPEAFSLREVRRWSDPNSPS